MSRATKTGPALFDTETRVVTCGKCETWFGWLPDEPAECPMCGRPFIPPTIKIQESAP